jgi:hypothetical protein
MSGVEEAADGDGGKKHRSGERATFISAQKSASRYKQLMVSADW